ncbi:MAG: ABC transporter ATP-binding protein [Lachnospiraceae bacterium]|nr:ABC transporter ATP-binding protein [Lachnospiraceae bacterium]MBO4670094.1 ABC transporter ATP-binding protein [Lachnospiraceae bacterium]
MTAETVLELKEVTKNYGDFRLDKVSFSVPKGTVCGFIGQNGAGKTTTIRLILDSVQRDGGTITMFGQEVIPGKSDSLREDVGVVFDEMGFHEFLTPKQIDKIMKHVYKNWNSELFFTYLTRFGLPSGKKCGDYSRGMRMKLQIAVALSHDAKLLIMDEPTSGLDPIVRNEMIQIFREFVVEEDHTILLSSHITTDLEKIADEVVFIEGGRIVLSGNKDEILMKHGLLKCKKEDADKISDSFAVYREIDDFHAEILVNDRESCAKLYPNAVIEPATLEEIMIHYVNRMKTSGREGV